MSSQDGPHNDSDPRPFAQSMCWTCRHLRVIRSGKGSTFLMCGYAVENKLGRKYPPQPVLQCGAYAANAKEN